MQPERRGARGSAQEASPRRDCSADALEQRRAGAQAAGNEEARNPSWCLTRPHPPCLPHSPTQQAGASPTQPRPWSCPPEPGTRCHSALGPAPAPPRTLTRCHSALSPAPHAPSSSVSAPPATCGPRPAGAPALSLSPRPRPRPFSPTRTRAVIQPSAPPWPARGSAPPACPHAVTQP